MAPTASTPAPLDLTGSIIAFEDGELSPEDTLTLFAGLLATGLAWQLQGFYGRTAQDLLNAGLITQAPDGTFTTHPELLTE